MRMEVCTDWLSQAGLVSSARIRAFCTPAVKAARRPVVTYMRAWWRSFLALGLETEVWGVFPE